ncbi:MAG: signal peptidase I [Cyanobacteria bacterium J06648_16]
MSAVRPLQSSQRGSPWLAVNLSLVWPGLGQLCSRQIGFGLLLAILFLGLLWRGSWEIWAPPGQTMAGLTYLAVAGGVYLIAPWLAHRQARLRRPSSGLSRQSPSTASRKDAWYGFFLEQVLPGMGHLYIGQTLLGGAFLLLGVGLAYTANNGQANLLPLAYGLWAIAGYHVYRVTNHRTGQTAVLLIAIALMSWRLIVGYLPTLIDQNVLQCIVPSQSMQPTLQVNDRLFVSRDRGYRPQPSHIVVFTAPVQAIATLEVQPDTLLVKRIVGTPGDQVQIGNGQVWVNHQAIDEPYAQSPAYTWGPETVPPDTYFVLGDNRNESGDSHVWGYLPAANILGQAYKIYWPPQRVQSLLTSQERKGGVASLAKSEAGTLLSAAAFPPFVQ